MEFGGRDSKELAKRGPPPPPQGGASFAPAGRVLAFLCGIPKFLATRIIGMVKGQCVSVLVDSGVLSYGMFYAYNSLLLFLIIIHRLAITCT